MKDNHYVSEEELRNLLISVQDNNDKESKEKLGIMILSIVKKLSTRSNFGSYTYKEDFQIRAIEHILLYGIKNFDRNRISNITNETTKAFSYITDIARRAFIAVLNEMKEEEKEIRENVIPFEEIAYGMDTKKYRDIIEEKVSHEIFIEVSFEDGILFDGQKTYFSLFDIIKPFEGLKLKIIYPENYKISLQEFENISKLNFEYLNISKFQKDKYIPSFPKRKTRIKEDLALEWE